MYSLLVKINYLSSNITIFIVYANQRVGSFFNIRDLRFRPIHTSVTKLQRKILCFKLQESETLDFAI